MFIAGILPVSGKGGAIFGFALKFSLARMRNFLRLARDQRPPAYLEGKESHHG
jgi:hypothetical protein